MQGATSSSMSACKPSVRIAVKAAIRTPGNASCKHVADPSSVAPLVTMSSTKRTAAGGGTDRVHAIVS